MVNFFKCVSCLIVLAIAGTVSFAQSKVRMLTPNESESVKNVVSFSQVHDLVGPVLYDSTQSIQVMLNDSMYFNVIPVRYESKNPEDSGHIFRCAVVVQNQKGAVNLIYTIGYNAYEVIECDKLKAVGMMNAEGEFAPKLLFVYMGSANPRDVEIIPFVLDWDAASGRYVADEKLSEYLEDAHGTDTIAGMKRALRAYDEAHKRKNR